MAPSAALADWVGATARRRVREPNTWSVCLILMLAVVLLWHQALVRFIYGRPHHFLQLVQSNTTTSAPSVGPAFPAAPPAPVRPLPTHAPVDPFRPLVASNGSVTGPETIRLPGSPKHHAAASRSAVHHAARPASGGCRAVYVVRSGDSLWSIAHHSTQRGTIHDWQALYAANRAAIGANPSYLTVGEQLCLSRH